MKLHDPFFISSRLAPALRVGDGTLSLVSAGWTGTDNRMKFGFYLDTPDFEYFDDNLQSGCGGCGVVEAFETFLGFLEAAVESYQYEQRTGSEGENTDLFPRHVVEWAASQTLLEEARSSICDEEGYTLDHLVEED